MVRVAAGDVGPIADRVVALATREVPFEQGSHGELVYVIGSGKIEIARERLTGLAQRLAVPGAGEYSGELGPLLGFPRCATTRAHTDVALTAYGVDDLRPTVHAGGELVT